MQAVRKPRWVKRRPSEPFGGRGPLYAWVRTHFEEIERLRTRHRHIWAELSQDAIEDGALEPRPGRSLRHSLWKAWRRVVRDIAVEAAEVERQAAARAAAASRPVPPSRMASGWQPPTVTPPRAPWATPASAAQHAAAPAASNSLVPVSPYSPPAVRPPVSSGRSYEMPYIKDEDLDMRLAPETYEDDDGQIVPMNLEARRTIARVRMEARQEAAEKARILNPG